MKEIIFTLGIPLGMSSDRDSHFIAETVQNLCKTLTVQWDLHSPWRSYPSGKPERTNQSLKTQMSKIGHKTSLKWPQALPCALYRVRIQVGSKEKVSPYEIL